MGTGPPPGSGDGGSSLIGWVGRRPDLVGVGVEVRAGRGAAQKRLGPEDGPGAAAPRSPDRQAEPALEGDVALDAKAEGQADRGDPGEAERPDRKSDVKGKRVSVRVDRGGRRIIKKERDYNR